MKCIGTQPKIGCVPTQFVHFLSGCPYARLQCMYLPFHLPVSTYSYFNVLIFIYATIIQLFLHNFKYFSTHIYTVIHTFKLLIYTFDVSYITLFFLLFLYQLYINQSLTPKTHNCSCFYLLAFHLPIIC